MWLRRKKQEASSEQAKQNFVEEAIQARKEANRAIHRAIRKVRAEYEGDEAKELLDQLYYHLPPSDAKAQDFRARKKHPVGHSFASHMLDLILIKDRLKSLGINAAAGANKVLDRHFGETIGIPVPTVHASDVSWDDCPVIPNTVIKPERGSASRGVFMVDSDKQLFSFRSKAYYPDKAAARDEAQAEGRRRTSRLFRVEEAILRADGKPANDWKVFAFYGEIAGVKEIDRNGDVDRNCFYTPEGECIRDPQRRKAHLGGQGINDEVIEYARQLSLAVPTPFLRIDFHAGVDGVRLGEITPNKGGFEYGNIRPDWDRRFSEYFIDAWARLLRDLMQGADFSTYHRVYGNQIDEMPH